MYSIIPKPSSIMNFDGVYKLSDKIDLECINITLPFQEKILLLLNSQNSIKWQVHQNRMSESGKCIITLKVDQNSMELDSYILSINPAQIALEATSESGIFYGIQSLVQIIFNAEKSSREISCGQIVDSPRFSYRGFMLDIGRHYHPPQTIKAILDVMAFFKLNKFHWHLSEDQGWRIEIKKYPKLTEIGSKRADTKIGGWLSKKFRGIPHEGYYSQEEIREIVVYAKERFIEIIPEIDMPGHSLAAIASYPELSCTGMQQEVAIKPGIYPDVYCPGNEKTFEFLENVLDEVLDLFPSPVFHIGGDEVPKARWKTCPKCQERMKQLGLTSEHELQVYFTNRIGEYLKKKGRRLMGWNEILGDSLAPDAIAQWWLRNPNLVLQHLRQGRNFVMSKMGFVYLDYNYVFTPLQKTYNYEPIPKELEKEYHKNVLGIEAPLWTEWVPTKERLGWQTFPRLIAVAETGWTPKDQKNYADFKQRLQKVLSMLSNFNLSAAPLSDVDPSTIYRFFHYLSFMKWPEI